MTNDKIDKFKTFLSIKKSTIYIGLAFLGLIIRLLDQPGNTLILIGLGLFLGHVSYRSVKFPKKQLLKIMSMLIVTLLISIILLSHFNVPVATLVLLIAVGLSLIIELRTK